MQLSIRDVQELYIWSQQTKETVSLDMQQAMHVSSLLAQMDKMIDNECMSLVGKEDWKKERNNNLRKQQKILNNVLDDLQGKVTKQYSDFMFSEYQYKLKEVK